MTRYKFKYGNTIEEEREMIKLLLLRYFKENGKLDERGIKTCEYLPSFHVLRNIIICNEDINHPKYDIKPLYDFIGKSINNEYYNTYFNREEIDINKEIQKLQQYVDKFVEKYNILPTHKQIIKQGINLGIIIKKKNGILDLYTDFGYKDLIKKNILYSKESKEKSNKELLEELKNVIEKYGQINCKDFAKYNLIYYNTYKSRFNVDSYYDLLKMIGITPNIKNSFLTNNEIIKIYNKIKKEINHIPTLEELKVYSKILNIPNIFAEMHCRWKNYTTFLKEQGDFQKSKIKIFIANDGTLCLSRYELMFCNYLYEHHINYKKEVYYKDIIKNFNKKWKFDFYIPQHNLYIEIFGIINNKQYKEKIIKKQQICNNNNINLISIFPNDFVNSTYDISKLLHNLSIEIN